MNKAFPTKIVTVDYSFIITGNLINTLVRDISGKNIGTVIGVERHITNNRTKTLVKMNIHDKKIISKFQNQSNPKISVRMGEWFDMLLKNNKEAKA